jgi:hypothetical protein
MKPAALLLVVLALTGLAGPPAPPFNVAHDRVDVSVGDHLSAT